jgi:hypothetical protein
MRQISALCFAIALVGVLAGAPASGTSMEDERTEAMMATIAAPGPHASAGFAASAPNPIAPVVGDEGAAHDLTVVDSKPVASPALFHGDVLYDLEFDPSNGLGADAAAPLDDITDFAQDRVIGLHEIDLGGVRLSN